MPPPISWGNYGVSTNWLLLVSPKKTIEGALGGFFAGLLVSLGMGALSQSIEGTRFSLSLFDAFWLGAF